MVCCGVLWCAVCSNEGIFVGPSAALNVVGAVKAALRLRQREGMAEQQQQQQEEDRRVPTVVTILCDGGDR